MRVLGVDPGLTRCGVGVVDGSAGRRLAMAAVGVVRTPADADLGTRLVALEAGLEQWLDAHRPECVAVERVFSQHNVRTVMGTAQASAVAVLCASRRGLPVALHTPSEVKAAVTGSGRADKAQVTAMVTRLLRLAEPPRPADAADALALAICHIWRAPALDRLQQARVRTGPVRAAAPAARTRSAATHARLPAAGPTPAAPPGENPPSAAPTTGRPPSAGSATGRSASAAPASGRPTPVAPEEPAALSPSPQPAAGDPSVRAARTPRKAPG